MKQHIPATTSHPEIDRTLHIVAQVHLAEGLLRIAKRAIGRHDLDTIHDMQYFLIPLFLHLEKAEIDFIVLNEYLLYLYGTQRLGIDPFTDPGTLHLLRSVEDDIRQARKKFKRELAAYENPPPPVQYVPAPPMSSDS